MISILKAKPHTPPPTADDNTPPPTADDNTRRPFRTRVQKPEHTGSSCCIYGCHNRSGLDKENNITRRYHVIPKDAKRRKAWLTAIPRSNWTPSKWDKVCSDHFVGGKATRAEGSPGYFPTLFPTKTQPIPRNTTTAQRAATTYAPSLPTKKRKLQAKKQIATPERPGHSTVDHDYIKTKTCNKPVDPELVAVHERNVYLESRNEDLESMVLSLDQIKESDSDFNFYTGFPNYASFKGFFDYLMRRSEGQLRYWRGKDTDLYQLFSEGSGSRPGPARKLTHERELFLTLVRLKTGRFYVDLARERKISLTLVSRVFSTWINFLAIELKLLFEMKCNSEDEEMIAPCFQPYKSLKLVIDCTELVAEKSSHLPSRKETFSNYKSRDTIKFMVGLSPNLTVNYVSFAFGGRASDKFITMESASLLNQLPLGSQVMADRGFRVEKELRDLGVELIIPDFKGSDRSQMTQAEVQNSEQIAMARIHIERIIQRIRSYHILDSTVKLSQKDVVEQMFTVCSYLTNFQTPIINTSGITKSKPLNPYVNGIQEVTQRDAISSSVLDILEPL